MVDSKRKAFIFLSLAFIFAVVTAWFVISQINEVQAELGQSVKVAVAQKDITAYTELTEDMIDWVDVPSASNLASLIQDEKKLLGHVSIVNMKKGDLFTANLVRSRLDIEENERIVWLNPTDNVIMDQDVAGGDRVDIIASYQVSGQMKTERILKNVRVVQSIEEKEGEDKVQHALKVSLEVPQAEQLIHMQNTAQQVRVLRVNQVKKKPKQSDDSQEQDQEESKPDPDSKDKPKDQSQEKSKDQQKDQSKEQSKENADDAKEDEKEQSKDDSEEKDQSKEKQNEDSKENESSDKDQSEDKKSDDEAS